VLEMFHELRKAYQRKSPGSPVPAGDASHIRSLDMLYVCQVEPRVPRIKVNATASTSTLSFYSAEKTRRNGGQTLPTAPVVQLMWQHMIFISSASRFC